MKFALILAIAGYAVLVALCVIRRGLTSRVGGFLTAYLVLSALPIALIGLGQQSTPFAALPQAFAGTLALQLIALGLLTFFALGWRGRKWWLVAAAVWLALIALTLLIAPNGYLAVGRGRLVWPLIAALAGWVVLGAALLLLAVYGYLAARLPLHANRVLLWLLVLVACLGSQALVLSPDVQSAQMGLALGLIGAAGLTYGTLNYRLFDVRDALRRGLAYLLSTMVVACVVLVSLLAASQFLFLGGAPGVAGVIVISLLLALAFQPLWRVSEGLIARNVLGDRFDPAKLVRDYSQTIGEILDVEQLATAVVGMISEVLEMRRGALLLVAPVETADESFRVRPIRGMGQLPVEERDFVASPVLRHFAQTRGLLLQYDIDLGPAFSALDPAEREWWHQLSMDVYLPIMGREAPIGILALGPKGTGESFRTSELELLTTLAGQTAVALNNSLLFGDLRQLNTEVNTLNEDLRRTNERLQRLDQVKSDFITIASHELRTPLTQVRGYTDILAAMNEEEQLSPKQVREIATNLSRAAERLEQVLSAMLDVSQIDVQAMSLHFAETTVDAVLRYAIEKLAPAMRERRQTLSVRGVTGLPPIMADFGRLTQVFFNLLSNAIKFTPDGGKVSITTQRLTAQDGPGDFIEIVVSDTGVGLDPKDQELIFEKFYRVGDPHFHSTGATKFLGGGPGLGLSIARGVVEGHGGRIWVESPGYDPKTCPGSSFYIVLPLKPPSPAEERIVEAAGAGVPLELAAPSALSRPNGLPQ